MKKISEWLVPSLMILVFAGYLFVAQTKEKAMGAQGAIFSSIAQWLTYNTVAPNASTTGIGLVYLGTATSSYTFNVDGVDQVNLNLFTVASSSNVNLYWAASFTNATTTTSDTWYAEDASSVSGSVTTHNAQQMYHVWNPVLTGTTTKSVVISNVNAKFMKIGFWAGTSTTPTVLGLWAQAILSKPY